MAKKRKRSVRRRGVRGLGLSPSEHSDYAAKEGMLALTQAKMAAYSGGSCDAKVKHAIKALAHIAKVDAHVDSGGRTRDAEGMKNLGTNMKRIIERCSGLRITSR